MKKYLSIIAITLALSVFANCSNEPVDMINPPDTGKKGEGEGNLAYEITFPADLNKAELNLTSLANNGYTIKIDLLGSNNKGVLPAVPAGYYTAVIDLCRVNLTTAAKTEVVHIYKGQTTSMTVDLTTINFASAPGPVQSYKIIESGPVMLENLAANQVFTVAVNKSAGTVKYSYTGGVTSYTLNGIKHQVAMTGRSAGETLFDTSGRNAPLAEQGDSIPLQYDKSEASVFNANPLPIPPVSRNTRSARTAGFLPSKIGDKRLFWLDDAETTTTWKEKQATLAAVSDRAEIWIMDERFDNNSAVTTDNKLTTLQAKALAEKFDAIYQYTTPVFGYEYGGGSNSPQPGGVDGNPKILILVYDIAANGSSGSTVMASFNRTIMNTIDGNQYTLYGFDIYQINRVNVALGASWTSYWSTTEKGPFLYGLTQNYLLDCNSFILLSCADWQNVSGELVVDMKKPANSMMNLHLVVK